jgi:hypothetical protein
MTGDDQDEKGRNVSTNLPRLLKAFCEGNFFVLFRGSTHSATTRWRTTTRLFQERVCLPSISSTGSAGENFLMKAGRRLSAVNVFQFDRLIPVARRKKKAVDETKTRQSVGDDERLVVATRNLGRGGRGVWRSAQALVGSSFGRVARKILSEAARRARAGAVC